MFLCRCPQPKTTASSCTTETTTTLQWSSTKVTSKSATILAASPDTPSIGGTLRGIQRFSGKHHLKSPHLNTLSGLSIGSTETINDGQFHTVELVTYDQMVNLSIDGGLPTTMDSFGAVRPLNGEAPLYVGGRGPLQNTPPSSAGTLNYFTTVNHHPSPPRFVITATDPAPSIMQPPCPTPSPTPLRSFL